MFTAGVIHVITCFTGPVIWQFIIEFGFIPGVQVNHVFFLILVVYTIWQSSAE